MNLDLILNQECLSKYNIEPSGNTSYYEAKSNIYNSEIYNSILDLQIIVQNAISNYESNDGDTESTYYINSVNFYKDLTKDEYKELFTNSFTIHDYENDVDYDFGSYFLNLSSSFINSYYENYLLVRQLEPYNCCFLETFRKLSEFYTSFLLNKKLYCALDQYVDSCINGINNTKETILNTDTENKTGKEYYEQLIKNISDYNYMFYDAVNTLKNNLLNYINTYETEIQSKISIYLTDLKLSIKVISLANIIFNAYNNDLPFFNSFSLSISNVFNLDTINTQRYYRDFSLKITRYCPNIFIKLRSLLKSDRSNYKSLLDLGVSNCFGNYGFVDHCKDLYDTLNYILSNYTNANDQD